MIELLVVLSLIVILATMGMTQYRTSVIHAREAVLKEDLFRMRDAIDQYYADKNEYPSTLDALVTDGYMRQVPEDPFTRSKDSWTTEPAPSDPSNPTGAVASSAFASPQLGQLIAMMKVLGRCWTRAGPRSVRGGLPGGQSQGCRGVESDRVAARQITQGRFAACPSVG